MPQFCPQLKQNIETIKTLKSELDLELSKLEELFKAFKNGNHSTSIRTGDNKAKAEFKKDCTELIKKIKSLKTNVNSNIREIASRLEESPKFILRKDWKNIYKDWFGKEVDFSGMAIPAIYDPEKHFGLFVPTNISLGEIIEAMEKKFTVRIKNVEKEYFDESSDLKIIDDRPPDKSYAIVFNNRVESDEAIGEFASGLKRDGINGITLKERLLMEIFYFNKTGKHLDIKQSTLCSGSRYDPRSVPRVYWDSTRLIIDWCGDGGNDDYLSSRLVVAL